MKLGILITEGSKRGQSLAFFEEKPYWFGCSLQADFILKKTEGISQFHCCVILKKDTLWLQDQSRNGTLLNGRIVHQEILALKNADIFRLGAVHFQVVCLEKSKEEEEFDIVACLEDVRRKRKKSRSSFPEQLGPYALIEILGAGTFSTVYKALDLDQKKLVALKIFSSLSSLSFSDPQFQERFFREISSLKKLNHPYIVRLYEGQLHLGKVPYGYIALEYFQGTNLEDAVALQGPFPWYVVLPIMQQILLALDHMHQQKILHRDIKPGNILFHPAYSVAKIIDLGLTKCFSASQQPVLFTTRTNVALGTPDFMPIEQWHNAKGVDHRADIYALGATLYYVLTGEVPYGDHSSIEELFKAMSQHKRIPLKKHCSSDVPLALIEIIEKMLAFDPVARYQTCQEVLEDFEKVPYSPSLFRTQNNLK